MNTRNRIILIVVITVDVCVFAFGLYQKNISEDYAYSALKFKTIKTSVDERKYTLMMEVNAVEDSLKKCCNR